MLLKHHSSDVLGNMAKKGQAPYEMSIDTKAGWSSRSAPAKVDPGVGVSNTALMAVHRTAKSRPPISLVPTVTSRLGGVNVIKGLTARIV